MPEKQDTAQIMVDLDPDELTLDQLIAFEDMAGVTFAEVAESRGSGLSTRVIKALTMVAYQQAGVPITEKELGEIKFGTLNFGDALEGN